MMTADELIQSCRAISVQQFPDSKEQRAEYLAGLLETKIRELMHRPILDLPVIDRGAWYGGPDISNLERAQANRRAAEVFDPFKETKA
jgi:hypothetical protein